MDFRSMCISPPLLSPKQRCKRALIFETIHLLLATPNENLNLNPKDESFQKTKPICISAEEGKGGGDDDEGEDEELPPTLMMLQENEPEKKKTNQHKATCSNIKGNLSDGWLMGGGPVNPTRSESSRHLEHKKTKTLIKQLIKAKMFQLTL